MGKRMVLDQDMNRVIEENIKKAWEERTNETTKPDEKGEGSGGRKEAKSGSLVGDLGNAGGAGPGEQNVQPEEDH